MLAAAAGSKTADASLPLCNVTDQSIIHEGLFEFVPKAAPPYNYSCWCMKAVFHIAPVCAARRRVPMPHSWRWTVRPAAEGRCRLPDPTPTKSALEYVSRAQPETAPEDRTVTVLLLGLSHMGQVFESLGCLYASIIERAVVALPGAHRDVTLDEIRANGGQCAGKRSQIKEEFPAATNPPPLNPPLPRSNFDDCLPNNACVAFHEPGFPRVKVCYAYQFNMRKNLKPNTPLPHGVDWRHVDAVFHMFPNDHFASTYLTNTNAPAGLRAAVVSVNDIYQDALFAQLKDAHRRHGFEDFSTTDIKATPRTCEHYDIHYALPGFTDYASRAWFMLLATGLTDTLQTKPPGKRFVGPMRADKRRPLRLR